MRLAKWFGFYTLTCFLVGQIFYWLIVLLNTDIVYSIYPIAWIGTFAGHPYGSFYRMFTYHYEYPILYWWVMSFCFGIVATIWRTKAFHNRPKLRVISGILVIPLSILFASIPGAMLWAFHDLSAGRQHYSQSELFPYMLHWIPTGLKLSLILYLISFPFNFVTTLFGLFILFSKKIPDRLNLE